MTRTRYSVSWKFQGGRGGGGSKVNMPFMGGMDIFWKYRIIDMLLARFLVANF